MTVVAQGYIGRNPADSSVIIARQTYRPTGVQTDFTFSSGYTVGYVDVYVNGVKLIEGDDFEAGDTSTVGLSSAAQSGDVVQLVAYKAFNVGNVTNATGDFTVGNDLTVNGTLFVGTAITANAGVISATQFVGDGSNLTGLANTDIISAQNFTLSGVGTFSSDIDVDGHTELDNLNVTGVATFSGPVSIAGTLSYEDVTNVDSVGLATFQAGIEIDDSITHLGDTNTKIRFPANDTFTVETNGSEKVRITSGGQQLVGVKTSRKVGDRTHLIQIEGTELLDGGISVVRNRADDNGTSITVAKSRSGSVAGNTVVQLNDVIGEFAFAAADGTDVETRTARIASNVRGAASSNDVPGDLSFWTNGGAASPTERMRITPGGDVGIGTTNPSAPANSANTSVLSVGIVTANEYFGDGSNLTGISVGLTTEDQNDSNAVITLDLTAAQDHRVVATGICTISVTNGSEADSHTVRIVNSGVSTVGFSTYFLFPSGATPDLPTADGAISLISFTVHRVGVAGTQLLAGASLNYS